MNYEGNVIRPPSEAASIILQVTVGCSHNKCTFCGAYKNVQFRIKEDHLVDRDIAFAAKHFPGTKKLFLADGDVLILSQKRLTKLLTKIHQHLPAVNRIRLYGNAKSILAKSPDQLSELKQLGVDRIYMGLESGHDETLKDVKKWGNSKQMIKASRLVKDAGIFLSVTVLLGLAGTINSLAHATETAEALNRMEPNQIAALTLMLIPGTDLYDNSQNGAFTQPTPSQMLEELRTLVAGITLKKTQFQANHASNYLPINCRLDRDKEKVLHHIDQALAGQKTLMPDYMRGL